MSVIDRSFVRINEGLVHCRLAGKQSKQRPILMLHASPACSRSLEPLILELSEHRRVIAPDTLGCGDSAPPAPEHPDVAYYADSMCRLMDNLGIDQFDVFGSHTGSHIGIEMALAVPERVASLSMDGVAVLDAKDQADFLENYAPHKVPDEYGSQMAWAWQYVRDMMIFFPHYKKNDTHIRRGGNLDDDFLHQLALDLLKNLRHYHKTYEAVFNHDVVKLIEGVRSPLMLLTSKDDVLGDSVAALCKANANLKLAEFDPQQNDESRLILEFVNAY